MKDNNKNIDIVVDRVGTLVQELRSLCDVVEEKFQGQDLELKKASQVEETTKYLSVPSQDREEAIKRQNLVREGFYLSEGIVNNLEQVLHNIHSSLPPETRKKFRKSDVAEMALRLGLSELKEERIRSKQIRLFLGANS